MAGTNSRDTFATREQREAYDAGHEEGYIAAIAECNDKDSIRERQENEHLTKLFTRLVEATEAIAYKLNLQ